MNKYYQNDRFYNSNSDILNVKFQEGTITVPVWKKAVDKLAAMLAILVIMLTSSKAIRVARALTTAVCLIGLIGVVGAIEQGTLGLLSGFAIGITLILIEAICLYRH